MGRSPQTACKTCYHTQFVGHQTASKSTADGSPLKFCRRENFNEKFQENFMKLKKIQYVE